MGLELQGRVLSTYMTLMMLTMPIGYVIIGPLADRAFSPMLQPGGALTDTVETMLGTGPGRGLALVILISAVALLGWTLYGWLDPRFRYMEDDLPDAVPDAEIGDRDAEQRRADEQLHLPTTLADRPASVGVGHGVQPAVAPLPTLT
ncbi:hypothetical protein ACSNN7_00820 [Micromonospora sp. URMC 105]|uniref:hypothetical protein n=1 Tax=Micromonospora sp. URMC 105 TaxID=3423413 RepID=UPI003F1D6A44